MRHFDLQLWVCYFTIITFDRVFFRCFLVCSSCLLVDASHSILIFFFGGKKGVLFFRTQDVVPTIKAAVTESPLKLWWVGLLYAVQNLLYFVCLQYTSAAAYQVLSAMAGFDMYLFQLKRISTKKKNTTCSMSTFPHVSTYLHILYRELTYPTWQKGK